MDEETVKIVREKFLALEPFLNERMKRVWAAAEAKALGRGGKAVISAATRLSRTTIYRGLEEIEQSRLDQPASQLRAKGGGRKRMVDQAPGLLDQLQSLISDSTRGDPESPLLWTCKSTRQLSDALSRYGYKVGRQKVSELLAELGYSLQGNRKTKEGSTHPDRDKQFRYLNRRVRSFQSQCQPVISVDTKKKELVGNFSNRGSEWRPKGKPIETDSQAVSVRTA